MATVLFHKHTSYQSTSDEWKGYVHEYSYYLDKATGKISCRTVTEFQDTRNSLNTVTADTTVEIERSKLSKDAKAKLADLE